MKLRPRNLLILIAIGVSLAFGDQTSNHEAAVSLAARRYRIQVYDTYHQDRPEYDRRINAGKRVWDQWQAGGARPDDANVVAYWYQRGAAASRSRRMPLPAMPILAGSVDRTRDARRASPPTETFDLPNPSRNAAGALASPTQLPPSIPTSPAAPSIQDGSSEALMEPIATADSRLPPSLPADMEVPLEAPGGALFGDPITSRGAEVGFEAPQPAGSGDLDIPIDLDVLESRVEAYNADLRYFETQLQQRHTWSGQELSDLFAQLRDSQRHGELTRMYLDLLPLTVRDRVGELSSLEPITTIFGQRLFESQQRAESLRAGTAREEVRTLKQISERLKLWTTAP